MNQSAEQRVKDQWPDAVVRWDMKTGLYAVFASFQGKRIVHGYKKSAWFNSKSCAWFDAASRLRQKAK